MTTSAVSNLNQPTDYNLSTLNLLSPTFGTVNLKPYLVELNYFEDIYNNTISGKIVISDAIGYLLIASLKGSELLEIEFVKATGGKPLESEKGKTKYFNVFSVSERQFDINNNFETYIINFCSEDLMLSERYRISKSYSKPMRVSDIVTDILENVLQTGTSYDIEQTSRTYNFILPNKKIFETINWLASYAIPVNKTGADMLFFENASGYKFKSLQTLYKQNSTFTYYYNPKNIITAENKTNFQPDNIYRLEVMNNFDTFNAIMKGTFSSRVVTFDPLIRKKYVHDFDYIKYKSSAKVLNESKDSIYNLSYQDRFRKKLNESPPGDKESGALRLMVTNAETRQEPYIQDVNDGFASDYGVDTFLTTRISQLSLSNYTKIKIIVPGNSDIVAGSVLTVNVYGVKPVGTKREEDNILSGNYLVTAVRHIITAVGYRTVVELAKDSNIGY